MNTAARTSSAQRASRPLPLALLASLLIVSVSCASGKRWVKAPFHRHAKDEGIRIYDARSSSLPASYHKPTSRLGGAPQKEAALVQPEDESGARPQLQLEGKRHGQHVPPADGRALGEFRNTYYDFPAEASFANDTSAVGGAASGTSTVPLMDRSCQPIKQVERGFFESLCVQGSGTLLNGTTVSFAKRDCACAEVCPRTSQKICFDALDPALFPWGRGALGKPITPLMSVAVDSDVIPLGTHIYIPEFAGVERQAGKGRHDGCFVAEDRGMKVKGKHVDIFTGNPTVTQHLNTLVPSNSGVHVYIETSQCQ